MMMTDIFASSFSHFLASCSFLFGLVACFRKRVVSELLNLSCNQIGESGGEVIGKAIKANSKHLRLSRLNLSGNPIGVAGNKQLVRVLAVRS